MEKYRKIIKKRMFLLGIPTLIATILEIYHIFGMKPEAKGSFIYGYQSGVMATTVLILLFLIFRYWKIVGRGDDELRVAFHRENDERLKAIRAKAGIPMLLITSLSMLIIGVIIGYYNTTIFGVLTVTAILQMLVACITKLIYTKIM